MCVCCSGVAASFFLDTVHAIPYNDTSATAAANTSDLVTGHFYGLAASNLSTVAELWRENLWPSYERDCQTPGNKVDFFTVFGVLFSGVTGIMAGANL